MATKDKQEKIAHGLGASRIVKLKRDRGGGPLDWLDLAQSLQGRLVSKGGRPSDPSWDTKRLVPFRKLTWRNLSRKAEILSGRGRKVGPAQLAAIMIEKTLTSPEALDLNQRRAIRAHNFEDFVWSKPDTACVEIVEIKPVGSSGSTYVGEVLGSEVKWIPQRELVKYK